MPRFTFTSPEGQTYDIDGPEGATPEQAFGVLNQKLTSDRVAKSSSVRADQATQMAGGKVLNETPETYPSNIGYATKDLGTDIGQTLAHPITTPLNVAARTISSIGHGATALGETVGNYARQKRTESRDEPYELGRQHLAQDIAQGNLSDDEIQRRLKILQDYSVMKAKRDAAESQRDPLSRTHAAEESTNKLFPQPFKNPLLAGAEGIGEKIAPFLAGPVGIPAGVVGTAGARTQDVMEQTGNPGQALGAGVQQGALDAAGGILLHGATAPLLKAAPKLGIPVAALGGVGYQAASSGITQQYNPEQAAQERSPSNLLLAGALGATPSMFGTGRKIVADQQAQSHADAMAHEQQMQADAALQARKQAVEEGRKNALLIKTQQMNPDQTGKLVPSKAVVGEGGPAQIAPAQPNLTPDLVSPQSGKSSPPQTSRIDEGAAQGSQLYGVNRPSGRAQPPKTAIGPDEGVTFGKEHEVGNASEVRSNPRQVPQEGLQPVGSENRSGQDIQRNPQEGAGASDRQIEGLDLPSNARRVVNGANLSPDELNTLKQKLAGWDAHSDPEGAAGNVQQVIQNIRDRGNKSRRGAVALPDAEDVKRLVGWMHTGNVPEYLRAAEEKMAGGSNADAYQLRQADNRLKQAIKQGGYKPEDVVAAMQGKPSPVPGSVVQELRNHIDTLSQRAINEDLVSHGHQDTFGNRMGEYTNDTYMAHDPELGPWWQKNIPDKVKQDALNEFQSQGMTPEQAQGKLHEMLSGHENEGGGFRSGSKQGPQRPGNLISREEMTPAYRAALGPVDDPRLIASRTASKQSKLVQERAFAKQIVSEGLGKDFFEKPETRDGVNYTSDVTMPDGKTYYTTKDIHDWLVNFNGTKRGPVADAWAKANAASKIALTAGNVGGFAVNNIVGNNIIALANLHVPGIGGSLDGLVGLSKAAKAVTGGRASEQYVSKLYKLGVIDHGVSRQEISAGIESAVKSNPLKNLATQGYKGMMHLAATWDNIFKINAFEMNKSRIKGLYPKMAPDAIDAMAANQVRDTYATYGRVFNIVKQANKYPGVTGFASYLAEIPRTTTNTIRISLNDAKASPKGKALAVARLAALGTAIMAVPTLAAVARSAAKVTDEEDDAYRKTNKYSRFSTLAYYRKQDGSLDAFNLGKYDPYSQIRETVNAATESGTPALEATGNAIKQFFGAIAGSPLVQSAYAAIRDQDVSKLGKAFLPAMLGNAYKSMNEPDQTKAMWYVISAATGLKPNMSDASKNLTMTSLQAHRDEGQDLRATVKGAGDTLDDKEAETIAKIRQKSIDANREAIKHARSLGIKDDDIAMALKTSGMHATQIGQFLNDVDSGNTDKDVIKAAFDASKWQEKHAKDMTLASVYETLTGDNKQKFIDDNEDAVVNGRSALRRFSQMQKIISRMKKAEPEDRKDLAATLQDLQSDE